jgi:hypothetical protein
MTDNEKLFLAGGLGLLAGGILMGMASQQRQRQMWQQAQQQAQAAATSTPSQFTPVSSTGSLNNGWMYYVTVGMPGVDLTQAANQATAGATLVAAGFVDPATKSTPSFTPGTTANTATALTIYNGVTGTPVPASTATFQWIQVLGSPAPEGLATV